MTQSATSGNHLGVHRKGIILAGGAGTRLYPMTRAVSKQLLPVYDKPMIYYPLSVLMLAGIRDVLIISTPADLHRFQQLLGDGHDWGMSFSYAEQPSPDGVAQAFALGKDFVASDPVSLILGDNVFHGHGLTSLVQQASERQVGATIFGYKVSDPENYGIAVLDSEGRVTHLEEKPAFPRSPYAVTGLYFYDNEVLDIASDLRPSPRGEYEITDVNLEYLRRGKLHFTPLGRGMTWMDAGTHESLHDAASFIEAIDKRQGRKVACPEEVALQMGFIDAEQLARIAEPLRSGAYGRYLLSLLENPPAGLLPASHPIP